MKSKKRYTEKIPKHTKIASFLLHLTPRFIFIVPPFYLHCASALSLLYLRFIFIAPSFYLHCAFTLSSLYFYFIFIAPSFIHHLSIWLAPSYRHYNPLLKKVRICYSSLVIRHFSPSPSLHTPSPWEKSPNRRVCDRGEDSLSFASKPRFYHF